MQIVLNSIFAGALLVEAIYDVKHKKVYVPALYMLFGISMVRFILNGSYPAVVAAELFLLLIMIILRTVFHGGLGGGDVKIILAGGLYLGVPLIFHALTYAILLAGIYCLVYIIEGRWKIKSEIPLCPFLFLGMTLSMFIG